MKSKLYFENRVAVLNDFIYQTGWSTNFQKKRKSTVIKILECFFLELHSTTQTLTTRTRTH
jgi:hypothetical protein